MALPGQRLEGGETHQQSLCASLLFWKQRFHSQPLEILQISKKHIHPSATPRKTVVHAGAATAAYEAKLVWYLMGCQHGCDSRDAVQIKINIYI